MASNAALVVPSIHDSFCDIFSTCAILWGRMMFLPMAAFGFISRRCAAMPRIGGHARLSTAVVLLMFLSWLAVPTTALATHGSFRGLSYQVDTTSPLRVMSISPSEVLITSSAAETSAMHEVTVRWVVGTR